MTCTIATSVMLASLALAPPEYGSSHWSSDTYASDAAAARVLENGPEDIDKVMLVGSLVTIVHTEPTIDSPAVGTLQMGDAVRCKEALRWYRVPGTSLMNELGDRELVPIWVRIEKPVSGYVSTRSLVDPAVQAKVGAEAAQRKAEDKGGEAGGGFSRNVRRNKKNLAKGVAGTPKMEGADYALIEDIILNDSPTLNLYRDSHALQDTSAPDGDETAEVGVTLVQLDPALAKQLDAEHAKSESEGEEDSGPFGGGGLGGLGGGLGGLGGGLGGLGGGGGGDAAAAAQIATVIADIVKELTTERTATPLEEYYLGRECAAMSTGGAPRLPMEHPLSQYVARIGHTIAKHSTMPYPTAGYHFTVLDDPDTPNAMAAPGGFIFITTGMLQMLKSEDQLAVILAHEIAHCEERHGIIAANESDFSQFPAFIAIFEMAEEKILDEVIGQALDGITVPPGIDAVEQIKSQLLEQAQKGFSNVIAAAIESIQKPSPAAERAADERGMALACAAGYDPTAIVGMLEAIKETTGSYGGAGYSVNRRTEAEKILQLLPRKVHLTEDGIAARDKRSERLRSMMDTHLTEGQGPTDG